MGRMRFAVVLLLGACGPSEVTPAENVGGAGNGETFESDPYAVKRVRLEQTTGENKLVPSLSLACSDANGTKENSWYRIFALKDFGVDKPFQVNRVNFGVQTAIGEQRVKVSIGTYAGPAGSVELDTSKIDMLGLTTIAVPEAKLEMMQANFPGIIVAPDTNLIVEIKSEGRGDGAYFYLLLRGRDGQPRSDARLPALARLQHGIACDDVRTRLLADASSDLGFGRVLVTIAAE
jgi:hypothetical protein